MRLEVLLSCTERELLDKQAVSVSVAVGTDNSERMTPLQPKQLLTDPRQVSVYEYRHVEAQSNSGDELSKGDRTPQSTLLKVSRILDVVAPRR